MLDDLRAHWLKADEPKEKKPNKPGDGPGGDNPINGPGQPGDGPVEKPLELIIKPVEQINRKVDESELQQTKGGADSGASFNLLDVGKNGVKIQNLLSLLFNKLAENVSLEKVRGASNWDIPRGMNRKFNGEVITECVNSWERETIVFVIDTSGSCKDQSQLYHTLATVACERDDVEAWDTFNAQILSKYDPKTKVWDKTYNYREGKDNPEYTAKEGRNFHAKRMWHFKNRHIIFFGDYDGRKFIYNSSQNSPSKNKIYWFNCAVMTDDEYLKHLEYQIKNSSGVVHRFHKHDLESHIKSMNQAKTSKHQEFACKDQFDFIRIVRKLR